MLSKKVIGGCQIAPTQLVQFTNPTYVSAIMNFHGLGVLDSNFGGKNVNKHLSCTKYFISILLTNNFRSVR